MGLLAMLSTGALALATPAPLPPAETGPGGIDIVKADIDRQVEILEEDAKAFGGERLGHEAVDARRGGHARPLGAARATMQGPSPAAPFKVLCCARILF